MGEHCPSHDMMQQFFQATMDRLSEELKGLATALTAQSKANGEAIAQVLENQADRRELCGRQNARLDSHDREIQQLKDSIRANDTEYWAAINDLRKADTDLKVKVYQYIGFGTGIALVVSTMVQVAIKYLLS